MTGLQVKMGGRMFSELKDRGSSNHRLVIDFCRPFCSVCTLANSAHGYTDRTPSAGFPVTLKMTVLTSVKIRISAART